MKIASVVSQLGGMIGIYLLFVSINLFAAALKCDICGMSLEEHGRNHIILRSQNQSKTPMHVCSLSCTKKVLKHDVSYTSYEVMDFNHPENSLSGDKAYFLIKSENIQKDLGDKVMSPYFGAFASKKEAEEAKAKYKDGVVVEGIKDAIK